MSHVVTIDLQIKSLAALENACKRNGWTFHRGRKTYRWNNYWVDDSPVPRHIFETEEEYQKVVGMNRSERQDYMNDKLGRCEHVITVPETSLGFEVGVLNVNGNWVPVWDWIDAQLCRALGGNTGDKLKQSYAAELTKLEAKAKGYSVYEEQKQDGSLVLTLKAGW